MSIIYSELLMEKAICKRWAKRYLKFVEKFGNTGGTVQHHLLPKAKDMWPEFSSFRENEWNRVLFTNRQHFLAHWMLWKALGKSQSTAFWMMASKTSRQYESLRKDHSKNHKAFLNEWYENGGREVRSNGNKKRVADKTHNFLGKDFQSEMANERVEKETHPFLSKNRKKWNNGKEHDRKVKNTVSAVNKLGETKRIPSEEFHSQTGPRETWEWVGPNSKEGKKRLK